MTTSNRLQQLLAETRARVTEIDAAEYRRRLAGNERPLLVDAWTRAGLPLATWRFPNAVARPRADFSFALPPLDRIFSSP